MNINKKVEEMISLNATLIEITPDLYRDLNEEILELINDRNIKVKVTDKIKSVYMYTYKLDCFAYKNKKCTALVEINCKDCKFYKK